MASVWYPHGLNGALRGEIDLINHDIRAIMVTSSYTQSNAHDYLDDVPSGNRVHTASALANKTVAVSGNTVTFDADDLTYTNVTGNTVVAVVIYRHTGTESTSRLLMYLELTSSVTPNGGDITLQWNANGLGTITT